MSPAELRGVTEVWGQSCSSASPGETHPGEIPGAAVTVEPGLLWLLRAPHPRCLRSVSNVSFLSPPCGPAVPAPPRGHLQCHHLQWEEGKHTRAAWRGWEQHGDCGNAARDPHGCPCSAWISVLVAHPRDVRQGWHQHHPPMALIKDPRAPTLIYEHFPELAAGIFRVNPS